MTLKDYTDYYTDFFIPAYADAIGILADKPIQLIIEQENSLSHLIKYLENSSDIDNLKKAKGHIERATLDSYKIVWIEIKKKLDKYTSIDKDNVSTAFNLAEEEVIVKLKEFDKLSLEARKVEALNIGKDNIESAKMYFEVVKIGFFLLENIDTKKYKTYDKFDIKHFLNNHIIGFSMGILSSVIVTLLMQ